MAEKLKDVLRDPGNLTLRTGSGRPGVNTRRRLGSQSLSAQLAAHIANGPEGSGTYPDFSKLDDNELVGQASQVVIAEIVDGDFSDRYSSPDFQRGVRSAMNWLLSGQETRSFGVQQFPGSSEEDAAAKNAALVEFADRLYEERGPNNG